MTVLAYLVQPESGGKTSFPKLSLGFDPKVGDALCWWNVNDAGKEDPATLHAGSPCFREKNGRSTCGSEKNRGWERAKEREGRVGKGTTRGTEGDAKEDGFVPGASVQRATLRLGKTNVGALVM